MPDSTVAISEGAGTLLDHYQRTITSNTVHQARVAIALPYLATYTVSVTTAVSTGTANSHLLQIFAGALNRVILRKLQVSQIVNAGAETRCVFQLLRTTTAGTGGTAYTPAALDPVDTATAATAMTLPSSKGTESSILWTQARTIPDTALTNTTEPLLIDLNWTDPTSKGPVIAAGAGIALKNITAVATATVHIYAEFAEAYYS